MMKTISKLNFDELEADSRTEELFFRFLERIEPRLQSVADLSALLDWLSERNGSNYNDGWEGANDDVGAWIFWSMPKYIAKYAMPLGRSRYAFSFGVAAHCILQGQVYEGYPASEKLREELESSGITQSNWSRHAVNALAKLDSIVAQVSDSESFATLCNYLQRVDVIRSIAGGYYAWHWQMLALIDLLRADAEANVDVALTTDAARWHWFGTLLAKAERAAILGEIERFRSRGKI